MPKQNAEEWQGWYRELTAAWWQHRVSTMAAAIAYRALFSLVPLATAMLLLVNLAAGTEWLMTLAIGDGAGGGWLRQVTQMVELDQTWLSWSPVLGWVVCLVMLYGASAVFRELTLSLTVIFGTKAKKWWQGNVWLRLGAFATILGVGGLLLLIAMGQWLLAGLAEGLKAWWPQVTLTTPVLELVLVLALLFGFLVLIYRWLPMKRIPFKQIVPGALLTTGWLWLGQTVMALLIQSAGVTTVFGAAGWILGFLLWVNYSTLMVLLGAEVVQLTVKKGRHDLDTAA
ncbi:hypothetical protein A2W24_05105 [Microgenomates group bacterium RBG_16_45_19]|nr:MAG: hypothetical protein A2W24_05105 [Microgenomates group bacterium RBG_16_45_19]